jgi:hypothetical protein
MQDKVTEIFVKVDDFCIECESEIRFHLLETNTHKIRDRKTGLCESEIISILILFHSGSFRNFKHYYLRYVCKHLKSEFPGVVSYNRFIELQTRCAIPFMLFVKMRCLGSCTGINYIDSTPLRVCHNRRIHQHKVFSGVAERGHCSMGWFFGFKLHLIINDKGELMAFYLTKANVDDRDIKVLSDMTNNIFGKLFGDKGYISKALSELLFQDGVQLITKVRKNMKKKPLSDQEKILLRKRALIETVNDELKNICQVEHTRHRSVSGFLLNILGALAAYSFFPKKPSINVDFENEHNKQLSLIAA